EQNPGVKVIQGGATSFNNLVCPTPGGISTYPRRAFVRGLVWGLVDGPVVWGADVWVSMDGGSTYNWATYYVPGVGATAAGMTHGTAFASIDLAPGNNYVFAILVRELPDGPNGSGNFSDLACQVQVEIHNGPSVTPPYDEARNQPQGGSLMANQPHDRMLTADR
ncbi:MAG: hypothetical protein OEV46_09685, partial [Betaproteobacteria bacterium]|nr:hypothetical protein [Betaproteobacteria bacterium]